MQRAHLDEIDVVAVGNEFFPSREIQPIIRSIDPVLVVGVGAIVLRINTCQKPDQYETQAIHTHGEE